MLFDESHHNVIEGNSFSHSTSEMGIDLITSSDNIIKNNICSDNEMGGIELQGEGANNLVANNTIERNDDGIYIALSSSNIYENNTIVDNAIGIHVIQFITVTTNNVIRNNSISDSTSFGVKLTDGCSGNWLYGNIFSNNHQASSTYSPSHAQAYDDGSNFWNISSQGNRWSDWRSPDSNNDGVVDSAYIIAGGSNQDLRPIASTGSNGSDLPGLDGGTIIAITIAGVVAIPVIGGIWYVRRKRKKGA